MQLNKILSLLFFCITVNISLGQENNNLDNTEIDFLIGYYEQSGNNAAVTGGIGSEELDDIATQIVVNIPFSNGNKLLITGGIDSYTSASSDQVDPIASGASGSDIRAHINGAYSFINDESNEQYGVNLGFSNEYDYRSISFGGNWTKATSSGNSEISLSAQFFYDIITLIYPVELRGNSVQLGKANIKNGNDKRITYSFSATYSQVLTKKLQASFSLDFVYQAGYLSTPFHRVYFSDEVLPRIETLPDSRYKIPFGLRVNYYTTDYFITRVNYRFYYDDFGITANTFNLELPIKLTNEFTLSPFYRYHKQTASDFFAPYNEANPSQEFYTSDYDLSGFDSYKYGVGLRYYPLFGLSEFSLPFLGDYWTLKSINLRASYYERSTGLDALSISLGLSFSVR